MTENDVHLPVRVVVVGEEVIRLEREIHARATVVTTLDNVDIIVPNGQFVTEQVVKSVDTEARRVVIDPPAEADESEDA